MLTHQFQNPVIGADLGIVKAVVAEAEANESQKPVPLSRYFLAKFMNPENGIVCNVFVQVQAQRFAAQ